MTVPRRVAARMRGLYRRCIRNELTKKELGEVRKLLDKYGHVLTEDEMRKMQQEGNYISR